MELRIGVGRLKPFDVDARHFAVQRIPAVVTVAKAKVGVKGSWFRSWEGALDP